MRRAVLVLCVLGCSSSGPRVNGPGDATGGGTGEPPETGGAPGATGGKAGGTGGAPSTGGSPGTGGAATADAAATGGTTGTGGSEGTDAAAPDVNGAPGDAMPAASGSHLSLGPGQPVVPPVIPDDCPGDLTTGFIEYQDNFKVQHPYDLDENERYKFENGIYTIWVKMGDKPHQPGNTTRERTEFRWSDISTGVHLWSGDFKVQSPSAHVCIFQVKNSGPPTGVYLRVDGGNLHQLNGSNFLNGIYDK